MEQGSGKSRANPCGINMLAVFWYLDGKFYGRCGERKQGVVDDSGRYLTLPYKHYEIWDRCRPSECILEFYEAPRGVVIFDTLIHKFKVFTSSGLCDDERFRDQIKQQYGLPPTTLFKGDEHFD